ncbi:hypothetical protein ACFOHK_20970 [Falsigemmobacter intermedius]|nr:hypothetical protein [Falsigemmobacter intermedius]
MKTIAVVMQKGGAAKSTLSRHGSIILPNSALLDLDPQGTTNAWIEGRIEAGINKPMHLIADLGSADKVADKARASGGVEWLIIDTPPEHDDQRAIRKAIEMADYVVVPTQPSIDDLRELPKTIPLIVEAGKPFAIVITRAKAGSRSLRDTQTATAKLADHFGGVVCPHFMGNRVAYTDAVMSNQTVTEYEPKGQAAAEVAMIWNWVMEQVNV